MTQPLEYSLLMDTGERLDVCELDPECFPCLLAPDDVLSAFLEQCSRAPREALEEAKAGYTRPLQKFLRAGALGAMLKVRTPVCGDVGSCVTADRGSCTLRNISGRRGRFPECWTAGSGEHAWLASFIAHAWRRGAHVVVISPTSAP